MSAAVCTGQPVSWLLLERFALGELTAARAAEVTAHLGGCEACREALGSIERDRRVLPALDDMTMARAAARRRRARTIAAASAMAAVAAVVLVICNSGQHRELGGGSVKGGGGDLSLHLVRERGGAVMHDPLRFRPGDRFKVLATCAAARPLALDLAVLQGGRASFPLDLAPLRCGNRVPLDGAFRLDGGEPAAVCLFTRRDRTAVERGAADALAGASCISLEPEPAE